MGPYVSLCVFIDPNASPWVIIGPYVSLWILSVLISPNASLWVLMSRFVSLWVIVDPYMS